MKPQWQFSLHYSWNQPAPKAVCSWDKAKPKHWPFNSLARPLASCGTPCRSWKKDVHAKDQERKEEQELNQLRHKGFPSFRQNGPLHWMNPARPSRASTWPLDSRSRMAAQVTFTSSIAIASLGKAWIWSFAYTAYTSNKAGMQNLNLLFDLMAGKVRMPDSNMRNQCETNLECSLSNRCSRNPNAEIQAVYQVGKYNQLC